MKRCLFLLMLALGMTQMLYAQTDSSLVSIQIRPAKAYVILDDSIDLAKHDNILFLEKGSQHHLKAIEPHCRDFETWFTVDTTEFTHFSFNMEAGYAHVTIVGMEGVRYRISRNDTYSFTKYVQRMSKKGFEFTNKTVFSGVSPAVGLLVNSGPVKLKLTKRHHLSQTHRFSLRADSTLQVDVHLRYLPLHYFGSMLVAKPSAMSDLAYGAEVGLVRRWGAYARFLTTFGQNADGDDVDLGLYSTELVNPYLTCSCSYQEYVAGVAYRPCNHVTLKSGVGYALRNAVWDGADGKKHNYIPDQQKGCVFDAGIMFDYHHMSVTSGASIVNGNWTGMVGLGIFW